MTQDYVFSKQTQKELTKLFTRTLNIEGAAPIKLNDGEAEELLRGLDHVIGYSYSPRACCTAGVWILVTIQERRGYTTLEERLRRDDYRKFITNKTEAEQVNRAVQAMINARTDRTTPIKSLSEQTCNELTKLFNRTQNLNIEGLAPIELSEDETSYLVAALEHVVAYNYVPRACHTALTLFALHIPGLRGEAVLVKHSDRDDYRKFITNKTEAEQVNRAAQAIAKVFFTQFMQEL